MLDRYDLTSAGANQFCEKLEDRAEKSGWLALNANIIDIDRPNLPQVNLITGYGQLTMQNIEDHATQYAALQTRQAQNAVQMYHFVIDSLSEDGRLRIIAEKAKYTIKINNVD